MRTLAHPFHPRAPFLNACHFNLMHPPSHPNISVPSPSSSPRNSHSPIFNPSAPARPQLTTEAANTHVPVLPHSTKKPGCGADILAYFRSHPELADLQASEIAIVGDRLSTDVMMANMMGSYGLWVRDGVVPMADKSVVSFLCSVASPSVFRGGWRCG